MFARSTADILPTPAHQAVAVAPKRDRRLTLTKIDKRGRLGLRITELRKLFTASLGDRPLTPMLTMRIAEGAELKALAEKARGDYLRGEGGNLAEVVSAERRADQAVRGLGIVEVRSRQVTLADYLAARGAAPE